MESTELISIIIPVYNTAPYIHKCVYSVLHQTYPHLEVILVDDGSTDGSATICDQFLQKDRRIKVIHQSNEGLSSARNVGIAASEGDSVLFVDSDDWIQPFLVSLLIDMKKGSSSVISVAGVQSVRQNKEPNNVEPEDHAPVRMLSEDACSNMLYQKLFDTSACAKLIPIDIVRAYPFPEGRIYEDLATVYLWILSADEIVITQTAPYCYRQRQGSIMRQHFSKKQLDEKWAVDSIFEYASNNITGLLEAAISRRFSCYCHLLLSMHKSRFEYPDVYKQIKSTLDKDSKTIIWNKHVRQKNRIAAWIFRLFDEGGLYASAGLISFFIKP